MCKGLRGPLLYVLRCRGPLAGGSLAVAPPAPPQTPPLSPNPTLSLSLLFSQPSSLARVSLPNPHPRRLQRQTTKGMGVWGNLTGLLCLRAVLFSGTHPGPRLSRAPMAHGFHGSPPSLSLPPLSLFPLSLLPLSLLPLSLLALARASHPSGGAAPCGVAIASPYLVCLLSPVLPIPPHLPIP
jgi:hypothetical protein